MTTPPDAVKIEQLLGCPFCETLPTVAPDMEDGTGVLYHPDNHCILAALWFPTSNWNTRASPQASAPSDWFNGDVDCDGNEIVTIRADELQRLRDEREKFMWQVRDTCTRAENAEADLRATPQAPAPDAVLVEKRAALQEAIFDPDNGVYWAMECGDNLTNDALDRIIAALGASYDRS